MGVDLTPHKTCSLDCVFRRSDRPDRLPEMPGVCKELPERHQDHGRPGSAADRKAAE